MGNLTVGTGHSIMVIGHEIAICKTCVNLVAVHPQAALEALELRAAEAAATAAAMPSAAAEAALPPQLRRALKRRRMMQDRGKQLSEWRELHLNAWFVWQSLPVVLVVCWGQGHPSDTCCTSGVLGYWRMTTDDLPIIHSLYQVSHLHASQARKHTPCTWQLLVMVPALLYARCQPDANNEMVSVFKGYKTHDRRKPHVRAADMAAEEYLRQQEADRAATAAAGGSEAPAAAGEAADAGAGGGEEGEGLGEELFSKPENFGGWLVYVLSAAVTCN